MNSTFMLTLIVVLAIYFVAMIVISLFGKKYSENYSDYLNMGRNGGVLLLIGGCVGGHIGNGFVVGGAGEGASIGIAGMWYGLGCCLSYAVVSIFIINYVYKKGYITFSDFYQERYNDRVTTLIYTGSTSISYLGNIAAQIMAGAALFEAVGLSGVWGAIILTAVVVIYSQIAGLWGSFATSVVQTAVIIVGVVATFIAVWNNDGIGVINSAIASGALPESMWDPWVLDAESMVMLIVPTSLYMIIDQVNMQRINSAKSLKTAHAGYWISIFLMIPIAIAPAIIGMYGAAMYGVRDNSAFFQVILHSLSPLASSLLVAAVLAAVMSTIDSMFIGASAVLLRDIYKGIINPAVSEKQISRMNFVLNIAIGVFSCVIAINSSSIIGMLSSVYTFLAACCFVPFVAGVLWKKGTRQGSVASSAVGGITVILNMAGILPLPYASIFPVLPALVAYIIVSLCTQPKDADTQARI